MKNLVVRTAIGALACAAIPDAGSEVTSAASRAGTRPDTHIEDVTRFFRLYDAKRCMVVLPQVRRRLQVALRKLGHLDPEARFPPVTIAVGRAKPVGVGSPVSADGSRGIPG